MPQRSKGICDEIETIHRRLSFGSHHVCACAGRGCRESRLHPSADRPVRLYGRRRGPRREALHETERRQIARGRFCRADHAGQCRPQPICSEAACPGARRSRRRRISDGCRIHSRCGGDRSSRNGCEGSLDPAQRNDFEPDPSVAVHRPRFTHAVASGLPDG